MNKPYGMPRKSTNSGQGRKHVSQESRTVVWKPSAKYSSCLNCLSNNNFACQ